MRRLHVAILVVAAGFAGWVAAEGPSSLDADSLFGDMNLDPHEDGRTPLDPESFGGGSKGGAGKATTTDRNPLSDSSTAGSAINSFFGSTRNARDFIDSYQLLDSATDRNYDVDLSGSGAPDVPYSLCASNPECEACYSSARGSLNGMRLNLERLRVAGKATSDFVAKSLALGDGLSGATGLAALEWQRQCTGINREFDHFKGTYDTKYQGMMTGLRNALVQWDRCEASFGERDWYARFGFLYMTFMEDKYKRNF